MTNWPVFLEEWGRGTLRDPLQHFRPRTKRTCPICDYSGYFIAAATRPEARCPNCASKERDRIFALALKRLVFKAEGKRILHFSAERPFFRKWKYLPGYVAGDIKRSRVANALVNIERIQYPDESFDLIICHHVLEHVNNDQLAVRECYRVLKPDGLAFFSVPLDGERADTWYPPMDMPPDEVERIAGWDHKRIYGRDFASFLGEGGFEVDPVQFTDQEATIFRLSATGGLGPDVVFQARKRVGAGATRYQSQPLEVASGSAAR